MAETDHAKGQRPIEAVIAAHQALVAQQRDFVRAVQAYNLDIAEYAMAVGDLSMPDEQFARMLVGTPVPWRPQPAAGAAPAPPGSGSSPNGGTQPLPPNGGTQPLPPNGGTQP